jgi:hypothetical protein
MARTASQLDGLLVPPYRVAASKAMLLDGLKPPRGVNDGALRSTRRPPLDLKDRSLGREASLAS